MGCGTGALLNADGEYKSVLKRVFVETSDMPVEDAYYLWVDVSDDYTLGYTFEPSDENSYGYVNCQPDTYVYVDTEDVDGSGDQGTVDNPWNSVGKKGIDAALSGGVFSVSDTLGKYDRARLLVRSKPIDNSDFTFGNTITAGVGESLEISAWEGDVEIRGLTKEEGWLERVVVARALSTGRRHRARSTSCWGKTPPWIISRCFLSAAASSGSPISSSVNPWANPAPAAAHPTPAAIRQAAAETAQEPATTARPAAAAPLQAMAATRPAPQETATQAAVPKKMEETPAVRTDQTQPQAPAVHPRHHCHPRTAAAVVG
jgi:hypothetical protein